jgi:hypothetical protein
MWHAIGIVGTGSWRSEQSLFHCVGRDLHSRFEWQEPILSDRPASPLAPQKHAPYVVYHAGQYHLFYRRPPGTILCVSSPHPNRWIGLGDKVFAESDARDICVIRVGDVFYMYYCQLAEIDGIHRSCILLRRSQDLVEWQTAEVVHVDTARPAEHSYLESPFVIHRPEGFYLFVRHREYRKAEVVTVVLFSDQPDRFPSGNRQWFSELIGLHAPEIVTDGGKYYIFRVSGAPHASRAAPDKGGWIDVAELKFQ